ncbi:hypothetical protein BS17DRAFT_776724 [Gyrodon lividus]|nr:hypothetical protein BS17DRAFT_776724 [Gyrodon lividus]
MGVNGLWPRCLLLECGLGLLKIGVDTSTWMHLVCPVFCYHHAGAGQNPELCTLFYRLAAISVILAHVVFIFDGLEQPKVKWGKQFCELLDAFGFRWHEHREGSSRG